MNYQRITILGNVAKAAEHKTSKDGKVEYAQFRVAVSGSKEGKAVYFPVTVFGQRSKKLAPFITKGRQILVEGRIDVSEKGYFGVVADTIEFGTSAKKKENPETSTHEPEEPI